MTTYQDLVCPHCHERETLSFEDMQARLRAAGLLKRAKQPDEATVIELLKATIPAWSCDACGRQGLTLQPTRETLEDDWGDAKLCERCKTPIPAERLELFPKTTLCMNCQKNAEKDGGDNGEVEYCPRCGEIMQLKRTTVGIARFVMVCPGCKR